MTATGVVRDAGGTTGIAGYAPQLAAAELDRRLGDPNDPATLFSYWRCVRLDEREEFPADICAALDTLGMAGHYVPATYGGTLSRYDEVLALMRAVARRDLTVAIAHGKTYLGAVSAWVGGGRAQAAALAKGVLRGDVVSWALTEREHGSDLLAGDVEAVATESGFLLHGEKWLINNATRGHVCCVLARTDPAGGPRGYSLLLADKRRLAPAAFHPLPKVRTHGIRGADISGIAFTGAELPADALIGEPGAGAEIVLKGLQLTRSMCSALSLGAGDHGLRLAARFCAERSLYGRRLAELPLARHTLAEAAADLLTAEAVSVVAARGIHAMTEEMSVLSAITKYLVPTLVGEALAGLGRLLGARAYLTGVHAHGMFQKIERDHRIVGLFDGNTQVNLNALINQFSRLGRGLRAGAANHAVDDTGLAATVTLTAPLPEFDPGRLALVAKNGCGIVRELPSVVARLRAEAQAGTAPPALADLAAEVLGVASELHDGLTAYRPVPRSVSAAAFELAERYAATFAAVACLLLWERNHAWVAATAGRPHAALWADGRWPRACLPRLLARMRGGQSGDGKADGGQDSVAVLDELAEAVLAEAALTHDADRGPFSLLPMPAATEVP